MFSFSVKKNFLKITLSAVAVLSFFCFFQIQNADAATLSLSPGTGVYSSGAPFSVRVVINTEGEAINAAEGQIKFNPSELRVSSISQSGSIFNLWTVEPTFSNSAGTITFGGGSPRGYTGSSGTIITINFVPQGSGTVKANFTSGSILAADGQGTNVLTRMGSGTFTITAQSSTPEPEVIEYVAPANTPSAPTVTSSTHPDEKLWYQANEATLSWSLPSGITAVRTALTNSPQSVPTVVFEPPISSRTVSDIPVGENYFHVQFRNENGWGKVAHYRLAVDNTKPELINISLVEVTPDNPEPTLKFEVKDTVSAIKRYALWINGGERIDFNDETGSSTYKLPRLTPGRHAVVVEAFDEAGNSIVGNFSFDIASFDKPSFTEFPAQIASDVIPVIKGFTRPNAQVFVNITRVSGDSTVPLKSEYELMSDDSGAFAFIPDGTFTTGVYELTAYAVDQFGAQSERSDAIRMVVADPGYVMIGTMLIKALSLFVPMVGLLFLLILGTIYSVTRIRRISTYVVGETKEAEASVKTAFADIRNVLKEEALSLAAARKTKQLTKAEDELLTAIDEALTAAERKVAKEVSDVDDIV